MPERSAGEIECLSEPLAAAVTISGTITFNVWGREINMTDNCGAQCIIERIGPTGAIISTVINSERGVEMSTSLAVNNWTGSPTSTTFAKGDRIRVRYMHNDAGGTMGAAGFFPEISWGAASAGVNGDTYVTFTETITFQQTAPTGTIYYFRNTASNIVDQGYTELAMSTSQGAGVATKVANSALGFTNPVKWTDGAGGSQLTWFTPQLNAFTLSGPVRVVMYCLGSGANSRIGVGAEIAVVANDGTNARVFGENRYNDDVELPTSSTKCAFHVAGDDVAVAQGERIRIQQFLDDATSLGMNSGFTATTRYDASGTFDTTADVTGVRFTETITEGGSPTGGDTAQYIGGGLYPMSKRSSGLFVPEHWRDKIVVPRRRELVPA